MQTVRKAYKVRLKTNQDIEAKLARFCGSTRFLWNKCLAMNLERLENKQKILWYQEMAFWLTLWIRSFITSCDKRSAEQGFLIVLSRCREK